MVRVSAVYFRCLWRELGKFLALIRKVMALITRPAFLRVVPSIEGTLKFMMPRLVAFSASLLMQGVISASAVKTFFHGWIVCSSS